MTSTVHFWPMDLVPNSWPTNASIRQLPGELMKQVSVGHAALEIDGGHGKIYISWFPQPDGGIKTVTGATGVAHTYDEDLKRPPARLVHLDGLDELTMIQKWNMRESERYSLFGDNCAQTVTNFLRHGGAQELIESWWSRNVSHRQWTYWSPKNTYDFALAVQEALAARR